MQIPQEDYNALLSELAAECELGEIEPDEVTSAMLAQHINITQRRACDILKEREQRGELVSRWVRSPNGKRMKAYRKAE